MDRKEWPRGVYLFTGIDGLTPQQSKVASNLYNALRIRPDQCAVLNEPSRLLGRYDLLSRLHNEGINDFAIHHVDAVPSDVRFPVFVRYEKLHRANLTDLIQTRVELDDTIMRLLLKGERPEDLIVVEWLDYKDPDGNYRKWGAQKIGGTVFGKHFMAGPHWMVKRKTTHPRAVGEAELPYVTEFPHHEHLERVWEIAGHDWARIDYSFYKGRVQVWEINDNPEMGTKWRRDFGRRRVGQLVFANFDRALDTVSRLIDPGEGFNLPIALR